MTWFHPHEVTRRADASRLVVTLMFVVLAVGFFRIQVLGADRYRLQSTNNRLRPVTLPAPRGLIVDRNGVVLAENEPGYTIALLASDEDSLRSTLARIADRADLDSLKIEAVLRRFRRLPHEPAIVLRDAPFDLVSALEESRVMVPGLVIQTEPKRNYPYNETAAHVLGYVGEITEQELASGAIAGARGGTIVGRDGLEWQYDDLLRGEDGQRFIEVDALGRTVKEVLDGSTLKRERQGDTLVTTLDISLQEFVVDVFPAGWRGAVVAMDPRTGDVLALYSAPSFDPNLFVGGMDPDTWRRLSQAEDTPLFNRAIEGRYPPASPFKLAVAASALRRGLDMNTHMETPCQGGMLYGNRYFRCWREEGHGSLTLSEAIQYSCDVYFYQLGLQLTLSKLLSDGADMGFGERSGIDLPDERTPLFPESIEYFNRRYGPRGRGWTSGVTLNLAIGQGENDQTVINMVKFYAKLANPQGKAPDPRLVRGERGEEKSLGLSEEALDELREALYLVVEEGTAVGARVDSVRIAGKTGTAQNSHGLPHGWFVGFGPLEDPTIVVGAIVEFAEHGSTVAPLVTNIIHRYLLGPEVEPSRVIEYLLPSDSAPEPIPILPDTSRGRPLPSEVGASGTAQFR